MARALWLARISGGLAMVVAGVAAMGAARPPMPVTPNPQAAAEAMARAFPTPRLYRMTLSSSGGPAATMREMKLPEVCVGAELFRDAMSSVERRPRPSAPAGSSGSAPAPGAGRTGAKGCNLTHETRPGGGFRFELTCDRTMGAASTSHMVMEGTVKDVRQHREMVIDSPGSDAPRIMTFDSHMVDIGACPEGMKPGQVRAANGEISDLPMLSGARPGEAPSRAAPVK